MNKKVKWQTDHYSALSNLCVFFLSLQSDIIHQSVLELIHSEDREEFRKQLNWKHLLPADKRDINVQHVMTSGRRRECNWSCFIYSMDSFFFYIYIPRVSFISIY